MKFQARRRCYIFKMRFLRIVNVRKIYVAVISLFVCLLIVLVVRNNNIMDDRDRKERLLKIDELIKKYASWKACKQPVLPVNSPEIMKFIHQVPPIDCSSAGQDWVVCKNSECVVKEDIKISQGPLTCSFTDVIRVDDFKLTNWETTHTDSYYKLEASDVVSVSCKSQYAKWSSVLTGIRSDKEVRDRTGWEYVPKDGLRMNVLIFGFDSLSRNAFIRKLPKSYEYLTEVLGAHVLQGYNIVGDGTPQALIPILTGKTELELPDTRKRVKTSNYVNVYPFIWNQFRESGYVTAYLEDTPSSGIFTYRLRGFDKPPTDHYMRPYYIAGNTEKWPKLCSGETPRHKVMLNQIKNFFSVYKTKPKFLFGFHGELSHNDYNLIGAADNDVFEFMKSLNDSGALDNTMFIFMADHGHRFADIRNTIQGKQEERLPFFSFRFPPWFKTKFPKAYENFVSNVDKLTTPFDIYPTVKNVLHMTNFESSLENRSISLFSKIPPERSCANAYIEPHWCACLEWFDVSIKNPIVKRLGQTLIDTINNYTSAHRKLCALLKIEEMQLIMKMRPNENLIKFNKNADIDGFVADMSGKMKLESDMYQIKALVVPGMSLFEASITHYIKEDRLELKISDISRINMYSTQARCIEQDLPDLRKYCYCKD